MADASDVFINDTGLATKTFYTVATLPAVAASVGMTLWVKDCSKSFATDAGITVTGGGTYKNKVYSDGVNWKIIEP